MSHSTRDRLPFNIVPAEFEAYHDDDRFELCNDQEPPDAEIISVPLAVWRIRIECVGGEGSYTGPYHDSEEAGRIRQALLQCQDVSGAEIEMA